MVTFCRRYLAKEATGDPLLIVVQGPHDHLIEECRQNQFIPAMVGTGPSEWDSCYSAVMISQFPTGTRVLLQGLLDVFPMKNGPCVFYADSPDFSSLLTNSNFVKALC